MTLPEFSIITWITLFSLLGGVLSVAGAALVSLNISRAGLPVLISYAIGAMLGAVFLEILPEAIEHASSVQAVTGTVLIGILLFFALEKLVIWRHCHGDHCEVHAPHDDAHCPEHKNPPDNAKFKSVLKLQPNISAKPQPHIHSHDDGRSATMILIGDTFHNFVDGVLIASAFMVDIKVGIVTALAIIAHEIPQEIGDFLILLHSGYSKQKALWFNLGSSLATLLGAVLAYYFLQQATGAIPYILGLAAASLLYVAVADLIPSLHKRTELNATISQLSLIGLGVLTVWLVGVWLH
ncbi:MAG TPA: ZIP family metal transporter [Methylotenera sp.]|nr:ZIP family metal transporter [Methylotenera sp.]